MTKEQQFTETLIHAALELLGDTPPEQGGIQIDVRITTTPAVPRHHVHVTLHSVTATHPIHHTVDRTHLP